jgi:hypothetical protein
MPTLTSVFNQVFELKLTPLGFVRLPKIKMFGRLINNEIFEYIYLKNEYMRIEGYKEFTVYAGVKSVYSDTFDLNYLRFHASDILYFGRNRISIEDRRKMMSFSYNDENIIEAVAFAFDKTEEYILPVLLKVQDVDSCIEYFKNTRIDQLRGAANFSNDSLIFFKAGNHDTFEDVFNQSLQERFDMIAKGQMGGTEKEAYDRLYDGIITSIAHSRDKVYADPELYNKALEEIEKRNIDNLETLRSYGVKIEE